jgi:hypothetical protein
MHWFHKFILAWNSTCFGQFLCPSSGVYSVYIQEWYMSYRFVDSFRAGPGWKCKFHPGPARKLCTVPLWHVPLLSVQWINFWWCTEELSETCRVSCQNKFVKLVHLVGFIIKKFVIVYSYTNLKRRVLSIFNLRVTSLQSLEGSEVLKSCGCVRGKSVYQSRTQEECVCSYMRDVINIK